MEVFQLIIGFIFFGLLWLLIRFLIDHKSSLIRSDVEKIKLKKQFKWSLVLALVAYIGAVFLMNSKATGWVPWLVAGAYIFVWAVGGYFVWRAYRIYIKKDITKANKQNGRVINNTQKFSRNFAVSDFLIGLSIWIFAIAIPIFKIKLSMWGSFFVLVSGLRYLVIRMLERADEDRT